MMVASVAGDRGSVFERVTVVGCGLIGGSVVKALRARTKAAIAAIDHEPVVRLASAWLDESAQPGTGRARDLVANADVTVLALPVGVIVAQLPWVLESLGARGVATDTGSVKRPIVDAAMAHERRDRFVGGHPMTGRAVGGFAASDSAMFDGARWYLVTGAASPGAEGRVADLVRAIGAVPVAVGAAEHDRTMAYASHAPQIIASALAAVAARAGVLGDVGPGFRDMTRIAGGPAAVWRDIFAANRAEVAAALADILQPLAAAQGKLASGGGAGLDLAMSLLDEARQAIGHDSYATALGEKEKE
jgi:prephenate dehydrogenase